MELLATDLGSCGSVLGCGVIEFDLGVGVVEVFGWSVAIATGFGVELGAAAGGAVVG